MSEVASMRQRTPSLRSDFPIFRDAEGRDSGLVYLDSGASAQKPDAVIAAVASLYGESYANIHRGVYQLSERATALFEGARDKVRAFLNAARREEIVFVRGTTEGMNLLAGTLGRQRLGPGDEVLLTHLEHHSNIVPWQMICRETGARLVVAPIDDAGQVDMEAFAALLSERTKIVSVTHVSNALGTINPVREMIALAREKNVPVILDGAQAVPHLPVDVRELGCDFYVFSGHKLYGPTGIGVVYGRFELLDDLPPWQGGGDMIESVSFKETTYAPLPARLEAGTPDIAGAVGLGAAIDYVLGVGYESIVDHGRHLLEYGNKVLGDIPGLRLVGTAARKVPVFSFVLDGIHPHDVGTILSADGIAVRTGHHCAQPVMDRLGVPATTRASLGIYNTQADLDALAEGIGKLQRFFGA